MCAIMVPAEETTHYSPPSTMENQTHTTLFPAAQAVLDAITTQWLADPDDMSFSSIMAGCAAAALRAAADQVVPEPLTQRSPCREHCIIGGAAERIRTELLAIAAELEGPNV